MKRYETLAEDLADSIARGVLRPGEKLPSVRDTSTARRLSASTVFKAYDVLEARGLVRARDRSGYYVLAPPPRPAEPGLSRPRDARTKVDVSELVLEIVTSTRRRDLVPLGSAFPSPLLFPLEKLGRSLVRATRDIDPWRTVDDLAPGFVELRRQIARRYLGFGVRVSPDEIVVTNGALEALNLCLAAVTRPGDAVVVESPTFYAALQAIERLDLRAVEVPTHPREGVDLGALEAAIVKRRPRACWLMTSFQNPLGSTMPEPKKRKLTALLRRHEVALIEDDVYGELYLGRQPVAPAKSFDGDNVLHCASFSKTLAPGYRIGWAAPGRHTRAVQRLKLTTSLASPVPTQAALADYLEHGGFDRHLRKLRETLALQQASMLRAIARYFPKGTRVTSPEGGYFVWVELPEACGVLALDLHRTALEHGISVAPGPMFSAQPGFDRCLRLNYGHAWDARMESAMATLGSLAGSAVPSPRPVRER